MRVSGAERRGDALVVAVGGRIDAGNAADFEEEARARMGERPPHALVLDLRDLSYVSSAGLRALMRLARGVGRLSMVNVQPGVYDVLEMTGFTEMFEVRRVLRSVSVEGCDVIGRGAKGVVWRLDGETIVKVANATGEGALADIARERELARAAFVASVPTAISYDVVRVGGGYGAVYELLDAKTLAELVATGEVSPRRAAAELGTLMARMHEAPARDDLVPSARELQLAELEALEGALDPALLGPVRALVAALPDDGRLVHGDLHAGNVMMQGGEALIIDMDTLAHGNAALELGPAYNAYVGFGELDHGISERFMGFPYELGVAIWEGVVARYADMRGLDAGRVALVGELMGRVRQLRRVVAHGDEDTEHGRAVTERCRARVAELLGEVETLEL